MCVDFMLYTQSCGQRLKLQTIELGLSCTKSRLFLLKLEGAVWGSRDGRRYHTFHTCVRERDPGRSLAPLHKESSFK